MTIGLKNAYFAPLATDTEAGTTYGAVTEMSAPIEVSIAPSGGDPNILYAGDDEQDRLYPDPEITVSAEIKDLPLWLQRAVNGHALDANGVTIKKASDTPPYVAIGIKGTKRAAGEYRYVWLYKCVAKPVSETFRTKEGNTVTRQTGKVEFAAIKRISDGLYQAVADSGMDGFTGGETFFNSVYETSPAAVTMLHTLTWALSAPAKAATPVVTMNGTGYTGIVQWSPAAASTFAASTAYTATVTLTASAGYMFNPYLTMGGIASLPVGATAVRLDDRTIRIVHTYAATGA